MTSITIRRIDDSVKERLRLRAAQHGNSMEDEARGILRAALIDQEVRIHDLAQAIRRRFEPLGGIELKLPTRQPMNGAARVSSVASSEATTRGANTCAS
jgi:plasmid stability protein